MRERDTAILVEPSRLRNGLLAIKWHAGYVVVVRRRRAFYNVELGNWGFGSSISRTAIGLAYGWFATYDISRMASRLFECVRNALSAVV